MQWLLIARIGHAQKLLWSTSHLIDEIARATGFAAPVTFRPCFQQVVELNAIAYRQRFKSGRRGAPEEGPSV